MVGHVAHQWQASDTAIRCQEAKHAGWADVVGGRGQVDDEGLGEKVGPLIGRRVLAMDEDVCKRQGDMSKNTRELLEHQKIVRDYLLTETPYRGLLLYHGLGSGKTCSSIAIAESLLSTRTCYVLLPASLQDNYR